ncbi:UDP-N-acetylmuramoyl-L-alanyl-D-glutamate--2,6-diaminopimelate ligase [Marinomonas agarivorans]|nr:UDP-N-acetylmuramoyl-L-alanyl-D-glutamate--2,6-diaminopimelate ligase [Marinomonas agarivorans]
MAILSAPIKSHSVEAFFNLEAGLLGSMALEDAAIEDVVTDSRCASASTIFFALPGVTSNGWQYLPQVASLGCQIAVVPSGLVLSEQKNLMVIEVDDVVACLASFLRQYAKPYPHSVVAVTGTNGKSSISYYAAQIAEFMGQKAGIVGTFGSGPLNALQEAKQTTPDMLSLHCALVQQQEEGVNMVALEASSHAMDQRRIEGLPIDTAVFSNLSRDHLDYHGNMDSYAEAKSRLFQHEGVRRAVIFLDDDYAPMMLAKSICPIYTYSLQDASADFYATDLRYSASGVEFTLQTPIFTKLVRLPLLGEFNVANAIAALAANWDVFEDKASLLQALEHLQGAPGRMQQIGSIKSPLVVVDYSHTPDSLSVALKALHQHTTGRLFCVYGCGGDRDKGKRPLMTQAVLAQADIGYLTSDNPRSESPADIIKDAITGINEVRERQVNQRFFMLVDRREAISAAIRSAKVGDVVLIAGKGHENYQEIHGVKHHFDDVEEAKKGLGLC